MTPSRSRNAAGWGGAGTGMALSVSRGRKRALRRRQHLSDGNVDHTAMMIEPACRLVAWPAGHVRQSFHHGGKRIEWRPMPRAGRPEDTDGLRAHGRGDMNET